MAGAPCVTDTCSVTSTVDSNGRLNINTRLDPLGGIACNPTDQGLGVKIYGDPAAIAPSSVGDCQLLRLTTSGDLAALRTKYKFQKVVGNTTKDFPSAGSTDDVTDFVITNNHNCARLVLITTVFTFTYTVANGSPYQSTGDFWLDVSGGLSNFAFDIGGGDSAGGQRQMSEATTHVSAISANGILHIKTYGSRLASDNVDGTGGSNGLSVNQGITMLDVASDSGLFTIA